MAEAEKPGTVTFETRASAGKVRVVVKHGDEEVDFSASPEAIRGFGLQIIHAAYDAEKMDG